MPGGKLPLSLILKAVDQATKPLKGLDKTLNGIGKAAQKVGLIMTAGITVPVVAAGRAAVGAFTDFQSGMGNVATIIDRNTESIDAMSKTVLQLGRDVPVPLDELTNGLYLVRSAGTAAADQFTVLEGSVKLAVAGIGTTPEAVDLVTSSIKDFGLKGEDAKKVYDQIFKSVQFGKTTISELAQGFGQSAPVVANAGASLSDYLAAVSALTSTGEKASVAHTQLRAAVAGLISPTDEARKAFRKLGVHSIQELIKKTGGLTPALRELNRVAGGNPKKIKAMVGSIEAFNAVVSLSGNVADVYNTAVGAMTTGAEQLSGAFEVKNAELAASSQRARNSLAAMGVSIGTILAPSLARLSSAIAGVADWFSGLSEGTQTAIVGFAAFAATLGPTVTWLGTFLRTSILIKNSLVKVFPALKNVTKVFGFLKTALTAVGTAIRFIGAAMAANPIGAIITAVAVAALLIYTYWDDIVPYFVKLWDAVKAAFAKAWDWIQGVVDKVKGAAGDVADAVRGAIDAINPFSSANSIEIGTSVSQQDVDTTNRLLSAFGFDSRIQGTVKIEVQGTPGTKVTTDNRGDFDMDVSLGTQLQP